MFIPAQQISGCVDPSPHIIHSNSVYVCFELNYEAQVRAPMTEACLSYEIL